MKVAPISGDAMVMLGLAALVVGGLAYVAHTAKSAGQAAGAAVSDGAAWLGTAVNPIDPGNLEYRAVNAMGNVIVDAHPSAPGRNADGSWSLGGWLYDVTHPGAFGT